MTAALEKQEPAAWGDADNAATAEALRKLLRREPTLKEVTDIQKACFPTATPSSEAKQLREALEELIALKDLKDRLDNTVGSPATVPLMDDYRRRKPLAWDAALAAIDSALSRTEDGRAVATSVAPPTPKADFSYYANGVYILLWSGENARTALRHHTSQAPSAQEEVRQPTMDDAIAAGDGTLHGAINHWQEKAEAMRKDAERYRLLRRGQHWSVIDGIGDTLRAEQLDAAIDRAATPGTQGGEV